MAFFFASRGAGSGLWYIQYSTSRPGLCGMAQGERVAMISNHPPSNGGMGKGFLVQSEGENEF